MALLDEATVVGRARAFVRSVNPTAIPVPLDGYLERVRGVFRIDSELEPGESGWSFPGNGKHFIGVNANHRLQRQRFTVCHEIAHIVLNLPSDHTVLPWWSYAKRPLAEILCDVFAAEILLPHDLFQPIAEKSPVGLASVESLADQFAASFSATGSRYAAVVSTPCAFVLAEQGKIRYASRSKALVDARAWIPTRAEVPTGSVSERARTGIDAGREQVDAGVWFSDWERGGSLLEEARHIAQWDQTFTLLWFEEEEVPAPKRHPRDERVGREDRDSRDDEAELLEELDGHLRWPGKRRRR